MAPVASPLHLFRAGVSLCPLRAHSRRAVVDGVFLERAASVEYSGTAVPLMTNDLPIYMEVKESRIK
jgi:hypothetical protein